MAYSYWSIAVSTSSYVTADYLQHNAKPSGCRCWRVEHLWKQFSAKFLATRLAKLRPI